MLTFFLTLPLIRFDLIDDFEGVREFNSASSKDCNGIDKP